MFPGSSSSLDWGSEDGTERRGRKLARVYMYHDGSDMGLPAAYFQLEEVDMIQTTQKLPWRIQKLLAYLQAKGSPDGKEESGFSVEQLSSFSFPFFWFISA